MSNSEDLLKKFNLMGSDDFTANTDINGIPIKEKAEPEKSPTLKPVSVEDVVDTTVKALKEDYAAVEPKDRAKVEKTSDTGTEVSKSSETKGDAVVEEAKSSSDTVTFLTEDGEEITVPKSASIQLTTKKGKETKVSAQELTSDVWGKQEVSRRLTEYDKKVKEEFEPYQKKVEYVEELFTGLQKVNEKKDGKEFVETLFDEILGVLPEARETLQDFYNKVYEEAISLSKMTEEQQKAHLVKQENESLKKAHTKQVEKTQRQKAEADMAQKAREIKEQHELDELEWNGLIDKLEAAGRITESTPFDKALEEVAYFAGLLSMTKEAEALLEKVSPDLATNKEAIEEVVTFKQRNPDASEDDLLARVQKLFEPEDKSSVQSRAKKNAKATGKLPVTKSKSQATEFSDGTRTTVAEDPLKKFLRDKGINNYFV